VTGPDPQLLPKLPEPTIYFPFTPSEPPAISSPVRLSTGGTRGDEGRRQPFENTRPRPHGCHRNSPRQVARL